MLCTEDIYRKVTAIMVESLNVEEEQIQPTLDPPGRPGGRID